MQISQSKLTKWRCGGVSVLGASHVRQGSPNQDAIGWWPETGQGLPLILAIADGHGSAKSFRSQLGAAHAVQVAVAELTDFLQLDDPQRLAARSRDLKQLEQSLQQDFAEQLVRIWQAQIQEHLQAHPFTEAELQKLKTKDGDVACQMVAQNPFLAYGATLLATVVTPQFMLYLQLGDGDILCVDRRGQSYRPLPVDPDLIANETTSLCLPHAWDWLRCKLSPIPAPDLVPNLILLSTDGYANSFVSEADFCKVGPDYQQMLQELGFAEVMSQLPNILQETSQQGSGDDITLGLIFQGAEAITTARSSGEATFLQNSAINSPANSQASQTRRQTGSTHLRPGRTRLAATSPPPESVGEPVPSAGKTRLQSAANSAPPAPMSVAESTVTSLELELEHLRHTNQQLQQKLKWLRIGILLSFVMTALSVGLAALGFWLARENLPTPGLAPGASDSSDPSPTQTPAQTEAEPSPPGSAPPSNFEDPSTDSSPARPERRRRSNPLREPFPNDPPPP
jgi:serine/threonine protein phosphatase PrpC